MACLGKVFVWLLMAGRAPPAVVSALPVGLVFDGSGLIIFPHLDAPQAGSLPPGATVGEEVLS